MLSSGPGSVPPRTEARACVPACFTVRSAGQEDKATGAEGFSPQDVCLCGDRTTCPPPGRVEHRRIPGGTDRWKQEEEEVEEGGGEDEEVGR